MGLMGRFFGIGREARQVGQAVSGVLRVLRPDATRQMELGQQAVDSARRQYAAEFGGRGRFDRIIDALNRLPRPVLAFGTIGLFVYAMISPDAFAHRMQGLAQVPDPLWWLLGAIVSFYFGARELSYLRGAGRAAPSRRRHAARDHNPALEEWRAGGDR